MQNCLQGKQSVITEEEKETNPVYRVVYAKIRNLNKKLTQIQHIETFDRKTLKPAQVSKLNKKDQIIKEITQQQEFAARYKTIMIQNNLVYDKMDDLIKISALLTVGKRIQSESYCPEQSKGLYEEIYNQIFSKNIYQKQNQLSDQIIRVYRLLDNYLSKHHYYSQCQDYMTYIQEIDQRNRVKKQSIDLKLQERNQILQHVQKINHILHHQNTVQPLNFHPKKLVIMNEVIRFQTQKVSISPSINQIKSTLESQIQGLENFDKPLKFERHQQSESTNIDSEEMKEELMEQDQDHKGAKREKDYDFSKKAQERNITSADNCIHSNSGQREGKKRNRHKKRNNFVEVENIRKCSDTSLEPTPEKFKSKKIKYVEKN